MIIIYIYPNFIHKFIPHFPSIFIRPSGVDDQIYIYIQTLFTNLFLNIIYFLQFFHTFFFFFPLQFFHFYSYIYFPNFIHKFFPQYYLFQFGSWIHHKTMPFSKLYSQIFLFIPQYIHIILCIIFVNNICIHCIFECVYRKFVCVVSL